MQLLMSFLEMMQPAESAPVWPTLEQAHKDEIVVMLARLIAKAAAVQGQAVVDGEEAHDE